MEYDDISDIDTTTDIDRALITIIEIAALLTVVTLFIFMTYIIGGTLLSQIGGMSLPYSFLSVNSDPVFNILVTVSGVTIGTGCLALVFFALVSQKNDAGVGIVVFFALVGLGFAAGLVRLSIAVTLRFLVHLIP